MSFIRRYIWLIIGLVLFAIVAYQLSWAETLNTLSQLTAEAIVILIVANLLALLPMFSRWWVILRAQGYHIPFWNVARYSLGGFAISYITPGPQFGGEPFQVIQLQKHHHVPISAATASVTIEKVLMLFINLLFLVPGTFLVVQNQLFSSADIAWGLAPAIIAFGLLTGLMLAWGTGKQPLGQFLGYWWPNGALTHETLKTEAEIAIFCRQHPSAILTATGWAALNWVLLAFEYWLMARFLGINVSGVQGLMMLTVFRLALLMPIPAGLGAVEGGHVWILGALGFAPAIELALSLSLLIRFRDIVITGIGLWCARAR